MPRALDADEVCRLLASGANVVTTRGEFHHPPSMDPALRERVEAACAEGGTSIHSTGSSPGFITEALPLVLSRRIQRRLDGLTIDEFADLSRRPSPDLLFGIMGFGKPPAAFDERRLSHGRTSFGPSLRLLAERARPAARRRRGERRGRRGQPDRRDRGRHARGRHRRRPAADGGGHARRPPAAALPGPLVLHDRARAGVGPGGDGLAGDGRGRRPARHRPAVRGADRADGRRLARLHRPPGGQRRAGGVRGAARASAPRSTSPRSSPPWADRRVGQQPRRGTRFRSARRSVPSPRG